MLLGLTGIGIVVLLVAFRMYDNRRYRKTVESRCETTPGYRERMLGIPKANDASDDF